MTGPAEVYRRSQSGGMHGLSRHADAAYAVGVVREQRGETDAAAQAFRLALEVRPAWTPALTELAWTLVVFPDPASRQSAEALRLARAVSSQPGAADARATEVLAAAQAAAGLFDDAVASARAAIALLPPEASRGLRQAMEDRLELYRRREPFYAVSPGPR